MGIARVRLHFARVSRFGVATLLLSLVQLYVSADSQQEIRGTVKDRSGAVVARAQVELHMGNQVLSRVTQADGTFVFNGVNGSSGTIVVTASGFAATTTPWSAGQNQLTIILALAPIQQSLDVTATRTAILPTGVDDLEAQPDAVVVSDTQLQQWGALATDDKLRQVPGFSLLRRSGSQTANPTSQGVSLRGLGASGASRALVLADGIPLNDPFGGWIYWARIPQASLDQVQLVPGGVSALYGNDALGGVINLETRPAVQTAGNVEVSYGNENSPFGSGWGALRFGQWAVTASGEGFRTNGYIDVPETLSRHCRYPGQCAIRQRKPAPGAALQRSRPGVSERHSVWRRPPERHAVADQRHYYSAAGLWYGLQQSHGGPVYPSFVRRNAELSPDILVGGAEPRQRVADRRAKCSGTADGADRAMVEATRSSLHVAGGPRRHLRSRRKPGDNVLGRQPHRPAVEWRHAGGAGRFSGRHCADHLALVADPGGPGRSVEQLRCQLDTHTGARDGDRSRLSRPRPERL